MGMFSWFNDFFDSSGSGADIDAHSCTPGINPATGLPMMDCSNTIDVAGNPFGVDLHHDTTPISDSFSSTSISDDISSSSMFDDSWSSSRA